MLHCYLFSREYCNTYNDKVFVIAYERAMTRAYENYAAVRKTLESHILGFMSDLENGVDFYIKTSAQWLYDYAEQYKGYVTCIFDLGLITEKEYDIMWDFAKMIQSEVDEIMQSYI